MNFSRDNEVSAVYVNVSVPSTQTEIVSIIVQENKNFIKKKKGESITIII